MQYRRTRIAGGTYFFTVNLAEGSKTFLIDYVDILRDIFRQVKSRHPFKIDAIVILPDHLHAIWTLPTNETDYATRWMLIKSGFEIFLKVKDVIEVEFYGKKEAFGKGVIGNTLLEMKKISEGILNIFIITRSNMVRF